MSENPNNAPSTSRRRDSSPDPALDVRNELFDPMKALYSKKVVLPYPNAPIYDNVAKFQSIVNPKPNPNAKPLVKMSKFDGKPVAVEPLPSANADNPFKRQFLPHQMMIPGTGKSRHKRNLLQKFEENWFDGPLARLQQCMNDKQRVKIYTRKESGILGHMTGIVRSFDKHWNMALSDVFEVWRRRKTYLCATASFDSTVDCTERLKRLQIKVPEVHVKSLNRRYVECSRSLPQVMIRGEQVALVVFLDDKQGAQVSGVS